MEDLLHLKLFKNNDLLIVISLIFGILTFASILFYVIGKIKPTEFRFGVVGHRDAGSRWIWRPDQND